MLKIYKVLKKIVFLIRPAPSVSLLDRTFLLPKIKNFIIEPEVIKSELWMLKILERINTKSPIKAFIDVGVNIGQTLLKLKANNPQARYIGFEPNPNCIDYTLELIDKNKIVNVELYQLGLSNRKEIVELEFFNNDIFDSSASTAIGFRNKTIRSIETEVNSLDSLINNYSLNDIDIIKIDIEGGELEALQGMEQTLLNFYPILIFEVLPDYNGKNSNRTKRQMKLSKTLNDLSYTLFHIIDKKNLTFKPIQSIPSHANVELSDYVAFPNGKQPEEYGLNKVTG